MGTLTALGQSSVLLAGLWVLYLILKILLRFAERKPSNGNGNGQLASQLDSEERLMRDIRALRDASILTMVEKVTDPIVKEIRGLREDMNSRRKYSDAR